MMTKFTLKSTAFTLFAALASTASTTTLSDDNAPSETPASKSTIVGLGGGFGAPYGFGVETGYLITDYFDINVGFGFSMAGAKTGAGTRLYFRPERNQTPFIGFNIVNAAGLSPVNVTVNQNTAEYAIPGNLVFHARAGYLFNIRKSIGIAGNLGYGFPFKNKQASYLSGSSAEPVKNFANTLTPGGVEIGASVLYRF